LGNVERFDGADAEVFDGCFLEDAAEEVFELDAGREIAAVGAEVDAAEDDFAVSRLAEMQYSRMTAPGGRLRLRPRTNGITQ